MSLRDLDRVLRAKSIWYERENKRLYSIIAPAVSEIVNLLGSAHSSSEKPWQQIPAIDFYEAWTGEKRAPAVDQKYVEAVMRAIKEREQSVKFMGQS